MNFVALKMLMGDRAKYLGIIMGLSFASLLITQPLLKLLLDLLHPRMQLHDLLSPTLVRFQQVGSLPG